MDNLNVDRMEGTIDQGTIDKRVYQKMMEEALSSPAAELIGKPVCGPGIPADQLKQLDRLDLSRIAPIPLPMIELYDGQPNEKVVEPDGQGLPDNIHRKPGAENQVWSGWEKINRYEQ